MTAEIRSHSMESKADTCTACNPSKNQQQLSFNQQWLKINPNLMRMEIRLNRIQMYQQKYNFKRTNITLQQALRCANPYVARFLLSPAREMQKLITREFKFQFHWMTWSVYQSTLRSGDGRENRWNPKKTRWRVKSLPVFRRILASQPEKVVNRLDNGLSLRCMERENSINQRCCLQAHKVLSRLVPTFAYAK